MEQMGASHKCTAVAFILEDGRKDAHGSWLITWLSHVTAHVGTPTDMLVM